jgi:hypothetical protein
MIDELASIRYHRSSFALRASLVILRDALVVEGRLRRGLASRFVSRALQGCQRDAQRVTEGVRVSSCRDKRGFPL